MTENVEAEKEKFNLFWTVIQFVVNYKGELGIAFSIIVFLIGIGYGYRGRKVDLKQQELLLQVNDLETKVKGLENENENLKANVAKLENEVTDNDQLKNLLSKIEALMKEETYYKSKIDDVSEYQEALRIRHGEATIRCNECSVEKTKTKECKEDCRVAGTAMVGIENADKEIKLLQNYREDISKRIGGLLQFK